MRPSLRGAIAKGLFSAFCSMGALGQAGCMLNRVDLVENGTVRTERAVPKNLHMPAPRVWQDDGETIVYGQVRRNPSASGMIRGHVDVMVIDPEGTVLQSTSTRHSPGDVPIRRWHGSSFKAKLAGVPPPGSTVRVVYHLTQKHQD